MDAKNLSIFVNQWYRMYGAKLPELMTTEFKSFITGTAGLAKRVKTIRKYVPSSVLKFVTFQNSETAYWDGKNQMIVLPLWYMSPTALEELSYDIPLNEKSIILFNGSMIHEALHSCWTKYSDYSCFQLREDYTLETSKGKVNYFGLYMNVMNIIEDLFIERMCQPEEYAFLEAKNALLFPSEHFETVKARLNDKFDPSLFIDFFVSLKNDEFRTPANITLLDKYVNLIDKEAESKKFVGSFPQWNVFKKLLNETSVKNIKRYVHLLALDSRHILAKNLAINLAYLMAAEDKNLEQFESDSDDESEADGEGKSSSGSGKSSSEEAKAKKAFEKSDQSEKSKVSKMASLSSEMTEKLTEGDVEIGEGTIPQLRVIEVEDGDKERKRQALNVQVLDPSFLRNLKNMRNINHVPGMPLTSGSVMVNTRLSRIATDGKIFSHRQEVKQRQDAVEVIILVDASGSTHQNACIIPGTVSELSEGLHKASFELFDALRELNIPVALFAHSGHDSPIVYHVTSYRMPRPSKSRAEAEDAFRSLRLDENFDGIVYGHMSTEFSKAKRAKIMIVLSDGSPYGPRYNGGRAIKHSREQIEKLKNDYGITSICLSIGGKSIYDSNSNIFGKENTLDVGQDIATKFEAILSKIAL